MKDTGKETTVDEWMDGWMDRRTGWMLQSFIHNYLPTLNYNILTFPEMH